MTVNAAVKEILDSSPIDELLVTTSQEYYNNCNPTMKKVVDIVRENGKVIILTNE